MSDLRKEVADIARAARRSVERERASGAGDLLGDAVARAEAGVRRGRAPDAPAPAPRGES